MESIIKAIVDKFEVDKSAGSLYDLVNGQMFVGRAIQDETTFPHIVFHIIASVPDLVFSGEDFESTRIQFSIYSKSQDIAEVLGIFKKLKEVYDRATLTFSEEDYGTVRMMREESHPMPYDEYWEIVADYLLDVQKIL